MNWVRWKIDNGIRKFSCVLCVYVWERKKWEVKGERSGKNHPPSVYCWKEEIKPHRENERMNENCFGVGTINWVNCKTREIQAPREWLRWWWMQLNDLFCYNFRRFRNWNLNNDDLLKCLKGENWSCKRGNSGNSWFGCKWDLMINCFSKLFELWSLESVWKHGINSFLNLTDVSLSRLVINNQKSKIE